MRAWDSEWHQELFIAKEENVTYSWGSCLCLEILFAALGERERSRHAERGACMYECRSDCNFPAAANAHCLPLADWSLPSKLSLILRTIFIRIRRRLRISLIRSRHRLKSPFREYCNLLPRNMNGVLEIRIRNQHDLPDSETGDF